VDRRAHPHEEEFRLTKEISAELWKARPEALILVIRIILPPQSARF
jgi:hypothetical protein